jgi:cation diffusion facilitator family transporter
MERGSQARRVTSIGLGANVFLAAAKYVAGIWGRSSAMIADATNSLSDVVVDLIFLIGLKMANKPADISHPYGHGKVEAILAGLCGFGLLIAGGGIFLSGVRDIWQAVQGTPLPRPTIFPFVIALITVVTKEVLHRYTISWGRRLNSSAVIAKAWDHRADVFASLGTVVGIGGAVFLGERWSVLDPAAAVVVSFFVVRSAVPILKDCMDELIEAALPREVQAHLTEAILSVDGVMSLHKLKTRRIGPTMAVDVHIQMDGDVTLTEAHDVSKAVEGALRGGFGDEIHVSVHMEPYHEA